MGAGDTVLMDNCAISACGAAGGWKALAARYNLETVIVVEEEAGTGHARRDIIDPRQFRQHVAIHQISDDERLDAELAIAGLAALDAGEKDLWIHALERNDRWILCGPDIASIEFGVRMGHRDRLVSLEKLFAAIGFRPKKPLAENQTEKWLQGVIAPVAQAMAFQKIAKGRAS